MLRQAEASKLEGEGYTHCSRNSLAMSSTRTMAGRTTPITSAYLHLRFVGTQAFGTLFKSDMICSMLEEAECVGMALGWLDTCSSQID